MGFKSILIRTMTQQELEESFKAIQAVGPVGSSKRDALHDLMKLETLIINAMIPNQLICYETSNKEQVMLQVQAMRDKFGWNYATIERGLQSLIDNGFASESFAVPNLQSICEQAKALIRQRSDGKNGQQVAQATRKATAGFIYEETADNEATRPTGARDGY